MKYLCCIAIFCLAVASCGSRSSGMAMKAELANVVSRAIHDAQCGLSGPEYVYRHGDQTTIKLAFLSCIPEEFRESWLNDVRDGLSKYFGQHFGGVKCEADNVGFESRQLVYVSGDGQVITVDWMFGALQSDGHRNWQIHIEIHPS